MSEQEVNTEGLEDEDGFVRGLVDVLIDALK